MIIIFLAHCGLLVIFFGGPHALISKQPLLNQDHGYHFYYSIIGSRFLMEHGTTWGYDPYLMAGYPNDLLDASDRLIKVAMIPMQKFSPEIAYKLIVFLIGAAAPLLFFLAGYWFGLKPAVTVISTLLGTLAWWVAGGYSILAAGLVGWSLASVYGIAFSALFLRYLQKNSFFFKILLFIAAPMGLIIHFYTPFILVWPCGVFYIIYFKKLPLRRHLWIFSAAVLAVLANFFWIIPYWQNLAFAVPQPRHTNPLDLVKFLIMAFGSQYIIIVPALLILAMAALTAAGFQAFGRNRRLDLVWSFGLGGLFLLSIFLFAGLFPVLGNLEPIRFGLPFLFLMVFPSAQGLEHVAQSLRGPAASRVSRTAFSIMLGLGLALCLVMLSFYFAGVVKEPLVGMNARVSSVRDWMVANTDRSARVLLEGQGPVDDIYGHTFATAALAYYTQRELIARPHFVSYYKNQFADLSGYTLFGRFLLQWDENSLAEYMNYYNIGWVCVYSPVLNKLIAQYPDLFKPLGIREGFHFYSVSRKHTFFLEGSGSSEVDYNRITLHNVHTPTGRVVIAYHWHPRLRVQPPAKIIRVMIGRDPVGFIGIENPQPEMIIETSYWGWH